MKPFYLWVKKYLSEEFDLMTNLLVLAMLSLLLGLNYYFDFEDYYIDELWKGHPLRMLWYVFLFGIPYFASCLIIVYRFKLSFFRKCAFWTSSLFFILVIAFDSSFSRHHDIIRGMVDKNLQYWLIKCMNNLVTVITVFLPVAFYYYYRDRGSRFYGLFKGSRNTKGYLLILLIVLPLVAGASFTDGFLEAYPRYRPVYGEFIPKWLRVFSYEISYGFSFLSVELLFRGCLVLGMVKWLGPQAIVPMAATYCCYHFGKPAAEAISSIFGGYLLGIFSYYSRSLAGGIIIHLGLAWMMELAAWLQRLF